MAYGYKSILAVDGEDPIELNNCSYTYLRQVNEKTGEIESPVLNGTVYAGYDSYPSMGIWEWALHYKFKNGKIKLQRTDSDEGSFVPQAGVTLETAACVGLKLNYSRAGGGHFYTQLTISSNNSVVGDTDYWVRKDWKLE
ncbi:MAG: hypothetical protein FWF46_09350 [Oscillospiraceae bacterium]|nr:hypothetical protein [Oscillospiraceae bacterium]